MVIVQINDFVFFPQSLMFPIAAAFFAVVGYKRLRPSLARSRADALLAVAGAGAAALLVSWLWNDHADADDVVGAQASLAAYWGAFAGVVLWALLRRKPVLSALNAIGPAVMAGGAVARLGCVFAGCCGGVGWLLGPWPFYDIAALLIALAVGLKLEKCYGGGSLLSFLIVYGGLRFALEFARPMPPYALGLSAAQLMALAQVGAGVAIAVAYRAQSRADQEENT